MFLALEPATTAVLIIGGVVIIGGGLWWAFHDRYRVVAAPSGLSMPLYGNVTVSVQVQIATSVFANWAATSGTIVVVVGPSGILAPNVQNGGCTAAAPFVGTVTGAAIGSDAVKFRGTNANGDGVGDTVVRLSVVAAG